MDVDIFWMKMDGAARLFARARGEVQRVPGSASTAEGYEGSRRQKQRFEYADKSAAGFVELHKVLRGAAERTRCGERGEQKESSLSCA